MKRYGSIISYDIISHPIRMIISSLSYPAVRHKFVTDYGLLPVSEEADLEKGYVEVTFHESVDAHTFLRHLQTMSPSQYEALEIPQD